MNEFTPKDALNNLLYRWWLLVIIMVLGSGVGWMIYQTQGPLYESVFIFTINVDYDQTGPLTERQFDHIQATAGRNLTAGRVFQRVAAAAGEKGIDIKVIELQEIVSRERILSNWKVRVRHSDPETVMILADFTARFGYEAIQEAYAHAIEAQIWQEQLDVLVSCHERRKSCIIKDGASLETEIEIATTNLESAIEGAYNMIPAILFSLSEEPSKPTVVSPLRGNVIIFGGALTGFLLGAWFVQLPALDRWGMLKHKKTPNSQGKSD